MFILSVNLYKNSLKIHRHFQKPYYWHFKIIYCNTAEKPSQIAFAPIVPLSILGILAMTAISICRYYARSDRVQHSYFPVLPQVNFTNISENKFLLQFTYYPQHALRKNSALFEAPESRIRNTCYFAVPLLPRSSLSCHTLLAEGSRITNYTERVLKTCRVS
jgi:hypothetical protein